MAHCSQEKLLVSMMKNTQVFRNLKSTRRFHPYAITKDAVDEKEVTQGKTQSCAVCEKDHHDIEDCLTFLAQSVQDRSKIIFKKKLCFTSLAGISKDHKDKKCSNRRSCKMRN